MPQEHVSRRWRTAFFGALAFAVICLGLAVYVFVGQAVTFTYMTDGYERTKVDLMNLAAAFPKDRYTKKDILVVLRRNSPQAFIVETPCTVQLDGLRFEFDNDGTLLNIETRAEYSPEYVCGI